MVGHFLGCRFGYTLSLGGNPLRFPWFLYLSLQCLAKWLEPPQRKQWSHVSHKSFSWQSAHPRFDPPELFGLLARASFVDSCALITSSRSVFISACIVVISDWTNLSAASTLPSTLLSMTLSLTFSKADTLADFVLPEKLNLLILSVSTDIAIATFICSSSVTPGVLMVGHIFALIVSSTRPVSTAWRNNPCTELSS